MFEKIYKILFSLLIFIFIQSCGYQPLLTDKYQKFNVSNVYIFGDKKLARTLGNYFGEIEGVENNLTFEIRIV